MHRHTDAKLIKPTCFLEFLASKIKTKTEEAAEDAAEEDGAMVKWENGTRRNHCISFT